MRRMLSMTLLLLAPVLFAAPQQSPVGVNARGVVETAEITGIDEDQVSPDLRDAVRKLAGQKFDQQAADDLVVRIQAELPAFIATTRLVAGSQNDRVKVVFVVEKSNEAPGGESNINSRYTVERVEIRGFDESKLSQAIRDEMQKLVGEKLDQDRANEIQHRLDSELRPKHYAVKKIAKGSDPQHIIVIYEIRNVRWIPFVDLPSQRIVFHSTENFSADITAPIDIGGSSRLLLGMANDQDQLLERFAGFHLGFETIKVGTDRLGIALRYSRYHERWQPSTASAAQSGIYRERSAFDPAVTFAFDPRFRLTAGVSLSALQIQYPAVHSANSNVAIASLNFHNVWGNSGGDMHALDGNYDFRAGNHSLDSEFIYTRHFVHAQYVYGHDKNKLIVSFRGGVISGNAPLFERFSLGDTSTLRGWNKFDVAPMGGNRVAHATLQYGFGGPEIGTWAGNTGQKRIRTSFHIFYDTGAVGDSGAPLKARHSVGFGFGPAGSFFMDIGFPIRASRVHPAFMVGFRF